MPRVLTCDNNEKLGAYKFPDAKKPRLCIEKDGVIVQYGIFNNDEAAMEFMEKLAKITDAIIEKPSDK